jgi:hypothetical protein
MRYSTPLVLLVPLILTVACSPGQEVYEKEMEVRGYDFTKYTEEGFLITPEKYEGEYESIGVLRVSVWPRIEYESTGDSSPPRPGPDDTERRWVTTDPVSRAEVIDSLYSRAERMGADAITRFESDVVTREEANVTRIGVEASGFAINRVGDESSQ